MASKERVQSESNALPLGKAALMTIVVIAIIAIYIGISMLFKVRNLWIPFLGLCVWSVMGMRIDMKKMAEVWVGAAVALLIAVLFGWAPQQFGTVGLAVPLGLVLCLMFCMISNRLALLFNMSTGIFLTTATAIPTGIQAYYFYDLFYGIVTLWFLPLVIMKVMTYKGVKLSLFNQ